MLGYNDRSSRDFSHFDTLSTEELRYIIRQDSMLGENEDSDLDAILYITEVLARREKEENNDIKDVETAWQEFKANYYPYTSDANPLFIFDEQEEEPAPKSGRRIRRRLFKTLSVAAVLALVIIAGTVSSSAMGFNLWGAIVGWTHETFGFSQADDSGTAPFENIRSVLTVYGIDEKLVPTWIPGEASEDKLIVKETPNGMFFVSTTSTSEGEVSLEIVFYEDVIKLNRKHEYNKDSVEKYTSHGIEHYIMSNDIYNKVVWANGSNECSITCAFELSDIYRMIDSIYVR